MTRNAGVALIVVLAFIGAGVALGVAGWNPATITGFLIGLAGVIAPLYATMVEGGKTHRIVNSQRSRDANYRKVLADTLREHGIVVPDDLE
jgi:hypothetical protein